MSPCFLPPQGTNLTGSKRNKTKVETARVHRRTTSTSPPAKWKCHLRSQHKNYDYIKWLHNSRSPYSAPNTYINKCSGTHIHLHILLYNKHSAELRHMDFAVALRALLMYECVRPCVIMLWPHILLLSFIFTISPVYFAIAMRFAFQSRPA